MGKTDRHFSEPNELMQFAERFLNERLESLEKDVAHCLTDPFAPFPALLYCFATIDLLGALAEGDASRNARTSAQSGRYMQRFMRYTQDQTNLLQQLFRHKLVHLAQPRAVLRHDGDCVSWKYWHDRSNDHLVMKKLDSPTEVQLTWDWKVRVTHQFGVAIDQFKSDVIESVRRPNGYLHSLEGDAGLQDRFEKAIAEVFCGTA
jgi:hypothetical protein